MDYLRIDGEFVRDILDDPGNRAMVRAINEIAQLMGIHTVAEYVQNRQILEMLREQKVDYAQGFAIHRPVSLETFWDH